LYRVHGSRCQQTTDIDITLKVVAMTKIEEQNAKPPGAVVATAVVGVVVSAIDCVPPVVGMLEMIVVIPACNI